MPLGGGAKKTAIKEKILEKKFQRSLRSGGGVGKALMAWQAHQMMRKELKDFYLNVL